MPKVCEHYFKQIVLAFLYLKRFNVTFNGWSVSLYNFSSVCLASVAIVSVLVAMSIKLSRYALFHQILWVVLLLVCLVLLGYVLKTVVIIFIIEFLLSFQYVFC